MSPSKHYTRMEYVIEFRHTTRQNAEWLTFAFTDKECAEKGTWRDQLPHHQSSRTKLEFRLVERFAAITDTVLDTDLPEPRPEDVYENLMRFILRDSSGFGDTCNRVKAAIPDARFVSADQREIRFSRDGHRYVYHTADLEE